MGLIVTSSLRAGYRGRMVLHDVNLDLGPGLHVVLGPNGAGKTTLFRVLAGVLPPQAGQVLIGGRDPFRDVGTKSAIGVSMHRAALAPRLTVADNLRYYARIYRLPKHSREREVQRVLGIMDLGDIAGQAAGKLSRGQSQRASLARALLSDPSVLILDEPFAGVDPVASMHLRGQLRGLATGDRALILSTHDLAEASEIADDVMVLGGGTIVGQGPATRLRNDLVGTGYRLRIKANGDLAGALKGLGYLVEMPRPGEATVAVADERDAGKLIAGLAEAGVSIAEATRAANPLEDIYLHLQGIPEEDRT
jgi:ABC-2 type transport system ATP-binding protein